MKSLNLKLTGSQNLTNTVVYIDDKQVTLKKNEFENLTYYHETENESVNIKIYKMLDVGGVWWFITQLFFFLISIFGIFDVRTKNKSLTLEYEADIDLSENTTLTLGLNPPRDGISAFKVESNSNVTEKSNRFFVDEAAKKKFKYLLISKIVLALAVVAIAIVIVVSKVN